MAFGQRVAERRAVGRRDPDRRCSLDADADVDAEDLRCGGYGIRQGLPPLQDVGDESAEEEANGWCGTLTVFVV